MDEPFSAVDRWSANSCRKSFAYSERVSKTIIMVTHDIDETMKLGDWSRNCLNLAASWRRWPLSELLNTPQNAFVADFIGKDRAIAN